MLNKNATSNIVPKTACFKIPSAKPDAMALLVAKKPLIIGIPPASLLPRLSRTSIVLLNARTVASKTSPVTIISWPSSLSEYSKSLLSPTNLRLELI